MDYDDKLNDLTHYRETYLGINIVTGTTAPRVEWFWHKSWSNFFFRISTKRQVQNLNQTSSSGLNLNFKFKFLTKPSFRISSKIQLHTSTKHQRQNTEQTLASKSCLNINFKILPKPCAQKQRINFSTKPQLLNLQQLLPTRFLASTSSATVKTSTRFELASSKARVTSIKFITQDLVSEFKWVSKLVTGNGCQWSDSGPIKKQLPKDLRRATARPT